MRSLCVKNTFFYFSALCVFFIRIVSFIVNGKQFDVFEFLLAYIVFLEQKMDLEMCFTDNKIKNLVVIFNYKLSSNNMFCKQY